MAALNNQNIGALQKIIGLISGPLASTAYSLPNSAGIYGVPGGLTFQNFLSNLSSSMNARPESLFPSIGPQGINGQAAYAYKNPQRQSLGGLLPQAQFFANSFNNPVSKNKKAKIIPPGLLTQGSAVIGSEIQQAPISPLQALVGQGSPPQYGQAGFSQGGAPQPLQSYSQFPQGGFFGQNSRGIGGLLSTFIFPVISLFGALRSLFGLRGFMSQLRPAKVNSNNLQYEQYHEYLNDLETNQEGSFDDYDEYSHHGNLVENDFDTSRLESF